MNDLWQKLQKHTLFRVSVAYLMVGWIIMQIAEVMGPALMLPDWVLSAAAFILLVGFPVVILITWALSEKRREAQILKQSTTPVRPTRTMDYFLFGSVGVVLVLILLRWVSPGAPDQVEAEIDAPEKTLMGSADPLPPGSGSSAQVPDNSIAVLPFSDLSEYGDQEYFADGITEELIHTLNKIDALRITGRISSFTFKGKGVDVTEIGQVLNVRYVLQGSVRKQGDQVRITAQLIDAVEGFNLWGDAYNGTLDNIFDVQEAIALKITDELKVLLGQEEQESISLVKTTNSEAYEIYLQARQLMTQPRNINSALALLEDAVALDPAFAYAHAAQAAAYLTTLHQPGDYKPKLEAAERCANKALMLFPDLAEAHAIKGWIELHRRNFLGMEEQFRRALEIDPNDLSTLSYYANGLFAVGKPDEAIPLLEKAAAIDPVQPITRMYLATAYVMVGNYEKAEISGQISLELGHGGAHLPLGDLAQLRGDVDQAKGHFGSHMGRRLRNVFEPGEIELLISGIVERGENRDAAVEMMVGELEKPSNAQRIHFPSYLVQLDETELALKFFEENQLAVDMPFWVALWSPYGIKTRQDPLFQSFAVNVGLVDYWQTYGWPKSCQAVDRTGDVRFSCT